MPGKTLIIAEAGVNHNGNPATAIEMIDVAVAAGADVIKFQTFKADRLVTRSAAMAEYQKANTRSGASQLEMLQQLELDEATHLKLRQHCDRSGIEFLSTAFDIESLHLLSRIGFSRVKVPSGQITDQPYLKAIGALNKPTIVSTGMADMQEIGAAIDVLCEAGLDASQLTVLHCSTSYPAILEEVNLRAMKTLKTRFKTNVGYSDHTVGSEVAVAAVALGATVIEKHFTLDKSAPGPDHSASLSPEELKAFVQSIRKVEVALGSEEKRMTRSESLNRTAARKSIVALTNIRRGEVFSAQNLTTKRPGSGISPMHWEDLLGMKSNRDYDPDDLIDLAVLESSASE